MGCMDIYIIYILNIYRESVCIYVCIYTERESACVRVCVCVHNFPGRHHVESVKDAVTTWLLEAHIPSRNQNRALHVW